MVFFGRFLPIRILWAASFITLLAACATTTSAPDANPHFKIGSPYKVNGKWYHPTDDPNYEEVGVASWYGEEFHGKLTANGEIFDMHSISAAHRTLPLPSIVAVENLENGRRAKIRVNDRGPFAHNRIIDLSKAAARELGFEGRGLARVRVRYLGRADLPGGGPEKLRSPKQNMTLPNDTTAKLKAKSSPASRDQIAQLLAGMDGSGGLHEPRLGVKPGQISKTQGETSQYILIGVLNSKASVAGARDAVSGIGFPVLAEDELADGTIIYRLTLGPFVDDVNAYSVLEAVREAGYFGAEIISVGR